MPTSGKNVERDAIPRIHLSKATKKSDKGELIPLRKECKLELRWTPDETDALKRGIEEFGPGHWNLILAKFAPIFKGRRRVVDLVTKYKLLFKDTSFYRTQKRDWILVVEDGSPETDGMGEIIVVSEKFPYDAAKKFAKKKKASGLKQFNLKLREVENIEVEHQYTVNVENKKICMRKMAIKKNKKE